MATWFELQIYKDGSDLRIKARGTGDRETEARSLGGGFDLAAIVRFGEAVQRAVKQGRPLPDDVRETARSLRTCCGRSVQRNSPCMDCWTR